MTHPFLGTKNNSLVRFYTEVIRRCALDAFDTKIDSLIGRCQ